MNEEKEEEPWWKGPIRTIITIFILLIVLTWTYAIYGGKIDPEPVRIPSPEEVLPDYKIGNRSYTLSDYQRLIKPSDVMIKQTADRIAAISCSGNRICQAKAMYYFVRNYDYIADPVDGEYIEHPKEFLKIGGGDCESGAIALASLLEAIGIASDIVYTPGHALLRIRLPEASNRYKIDGYIYLDWTCKRCRFGELGLKAMEQLDF